MISALLVSVGFFVLSVGWYGWRVTAHAPGLLLGMCGVVLMTVGFLVL